MPVVPYQPPASTRGVSAPAVRYCGPRDRAVLVQRQAQRPVHGRLQAGHADLAVALHGMGVAAAEQRALGLDGQEQRRAGRELAGVEVAAEAPGRHHRLRAGARRADAHRAHERLDRQHDVLAEVGDVAGRQVEDAQVRLGEVVGEQPEPGQDGRPAPAARVEVEDLDGERVARARAADGDRAGQRVDTIPVQARDGVARRLRRDLVVADLAGLDDDRVAALDRQQRLVRRVPRVVDLVGGDVVRLRHRCLSCSLGAGPGRTLPMRYTPAHPGRSRRCASSSTDSRPSVPRC